MRFLFLFFFYDSLAAYSSCAAAFRPGSVGGGVCGVEAEGGHGAVGPLGWEDSLGGEGKTLGSLFRLHPRSVNRALYQQHVAYPELTTVLPFCTQSDTDSFFHTLKESVKSVTNGAVVIFRDHCECLALHAWDALGVTRVACASQSAPAACSLQPDPSVLPE